ncbi:4-(cytidine 5'-diphospho)-2-C-methyl-D-erythritol kinase [Corallincola spongiicola]|uniref:4-diphosphocytidyl-2-C-methyl-D-erythritol kinase n=1 Tax=Corallincola spongiicola TaxID=2520508 RepID=A0ABY1WN16_9GAMM|nr:4-(cytidine 5'-diphospho)-2-C-methyl-D-erythritol kinase [Corallincola spongiicola]TAA43729.1 4-(cytidine 5'-diphospho)-2-C-methyl-D-erythritol kinase [Corallincola spongiicola]
MTAQTTNTALTLPSPAKLNLFLHINGRRTDGYHELQTVFQFVDYGDTLSFHLRSDGEFTLSPSLPGVADADNLIIKAAKKLQQATECTLGADIKLEKRLPMGGGIGGGSSNAATTLHGLNQLWQLGLSEAQLADIGLSLGADVPVFVRGKAAYAEGVGEKLRPVTLPEPWYVVLRPDCHVSTAEVFCDPALPRNTKKLEKLPEDLWQLNNDCQKLVCDKHPAVEKALQWLLEYAPARMTGTGSCVFAQFDSQIQANACLAAAADTYQGFVAQGINSSPLLKYLNT